MACLVRRGNRGHRGSREILKLTRAMKPRRSKAERSNAVTDSPENGTECGWEELYFISPRGRNDDATVLAAPFDPVIILLSQDREWRMHFPPAVSHALSTC